MSTSTATPKPKTLELFGTKRPDGKFEPFSLYSMRQAIEEGFILDVLESYATYRTYWSLLKKVADDPRYDRDQATYLLKSFADLHPHTIGKKAVIMVEHFATNVRPRIGGKAKAMIVTRSRLHAVRYKHAVEVANDRLQEMIDSNFKFYKQIADDRDFAQFFLTWLFDRYYRRATTAHPAPPPGE